MGGKNENIQNEKFNINEQYQILDRVVTSTEPKKVNFNLFSNLLVFILQVAKRTLTFLHNVIQELQIMEISCPAGSVACWVFLSTLEVLLTCQKACDNSPSVPIHTFFLQTADLWSYARLKLHELGQILFQI